MITLKPSHTTPGAYTVEGLPEHDDAWLVGYLTSALKSVDKDLWIAMEYKNLDALKSTRDTISDALAKASARRG